MSPETEPASGSVAARGNEEHLPEVQWPDVPRGGFTVQVISVALVRILASVPQDVGGELIVLGRGSEVGVCTADTYLYAMPVVKEYGCETSDFRRGRNEVN